MMIGPRAALAFGLWTIAQFNAWQHAVQTGVHYFSDAWQFHGLLWVGMTILVKVMLMVVASLDDQLLVPASCKKDSTYNELQGQC